MSGTNLRKEPEVSNATTNPSDQIRSMQPIMYTALILALVGVFVAFLALDKANESGGAAAPAAAAPAPAAGGAAVAGSIQLADFSFSGDMEFSGADFGIELSNVGQTVHNLEIVGVAASDNVDPGASAVLDVTGIEPGTYEIRCTIPGHAEQGMDGEITVS